MRAGAKQAVSTVGLCLLLCVLPVAASAYGDKDQITYKEDPMLLKAIEINMGNDKTVTNEIYNEFFREGSAAEGVRAILAAGRFYINGFPIPGTAEDFERICPEGYLLNQSPWLVPESDGYRVDRGTYDRYEDAALAAATGFDAGLEVRLLDETGDGFTDRIDMDYVEAVIVREIVKNDDGYRVRRAEPDPAAAWTNDGRVFDGAHFTAGSGEVIPAENMDESLKPGDMALFWYGPDGWAMKRALEVKGILTGGQDHQYYEISGVQYGDAMRFSRGNIVISNRCGEFVNAHRYFGFIGSDEGLEVSLWFVPTSDPALWAAPCGFTSGANASAFLAKAIETARTKLAGVTVSPDGSDVPDGQHWVTPAVYDELSRAIARAEEALASGAAPEIMDYHVYLLYFALHGSGSDIGARFAGFDYPGFDNQLDGAVPEVAPMRFGPFGGKKG